ncbi:hypothetical protein ACC709_37085, partial [Rhizobium ruizarguesonis]
VPSECQAIAIGLTHSEPYGRRLTNSKQGLSQILALNGMWNMGREIAPPKVVERADDSECYCRKAEAAIDG